MEKPKDVHSPVVRFSSRLAMKKSFILKGYDNLVVRSVSTRIKKRSSRLEGYYTEGQVGVRHAKATMPSRMDLSSLQGPPSLRLWLVTVRVVK